MKYLFIHGWSFSKDIWKDFFQLKNSIFLDLPFHNGTDYKTNKNILNSFSLDLYEYINNQKEDVVLIGWSLGASLTVLTALREPKNLKKIILIGFSPKFKDEKLGHNPKNVKAFMFQLKRSFEETIYQFRKTAVNDEFRDIPLPIRDGGIKILKEFIDLDLTKSLENIKQECVLIYGKQDKIINPYGSIFAKGKIKNSRLISVDSHHAPFLSNPDILKEVLKW